jgi:uncharacterized protein YbjT (DUF2867 family)
MRIVVLGGTGHIGRLVVERLENSAQAVVVASRRTGVDAVSGAGLASALDSADAVIDVTNAPHPEGEGVLDFFTAMTSRVIEAELAAAGVDRARIVTQFFLAASYGIDRRATSVAELGPAFRLLAERLLRPELPRR